MREDENTEGTVCTSVPRGWVITQFDDTCEPLSDGGRKIPQKAYLKSGQYPIIDQGEELIGGFTDDPSMLFNGKIPVIAFGDHTRRFKLIDQPFVVGADGIKLIGPTAVWNTKCLWYFLRALKFEDRGYSRHFQFLRKSLLPLPPVTEQNRIADTLDELFSDLDAGVAALTRVREKLKLYRASVLKAAVEGTLTASKKPFPLRPLGEAIASIGQGWSPKCESSPSTELATWAVIKTTAIQPLLYMQEHNKQLPASLEPRPHLELAAGDLLVTRAGPRSRVGVACLVKHTRPRLMLCDKAYRIRCKTDRVISSFLEVVLNAPHIVDELDKLKTGISDSGVNLTQDRLADLLVPFPSIIEQEAVVEAVEDQISVIEHFEADIDAKLKNAQTLRQAILHQAFRGQLVPRDPNDEPASELLKRIVAERDQRTRDAAAAKRTTRTATRVRTEGRWPRRPADGRRKKKQQKGN